MQEKTDDNLVGAISYLLGWLTGLMAYYIKKDSKFVKFHCLQSIIMSIAGSVILFIYIVVLIIVITILTEIIEGCGVLFLPAILLPVFVSVALLVFLMYKAYSGVKYKLPVIGNLAEKYI